MYLSSRDRKVWVMSPTSEYYSSGYAEPVGGIILPAPGTYWQDIKLNKRFINDMKTTYSEALGLKQLLDKDRQFLHLAVGPIMNTAICNSLEMFEPRWLPGDVYLCMDCQYQFWLEENGKRT